MRIEILTFVRMTTIEFSWAAISHLEVRVNGTGNLLWIVFIALLIFALLEVMTGFNLICVVQLGGTACFR